MVASIPSAAPSTLPPTTAKPTGSSALGKDQFLKLLMAQMSNQDPTAPQSNEQFIAQLAQFSTLESHQLMTAQLDALLMAAAAENQLAAADLIDKRVAFETDSATVEDGLIANRSLKLAGPADNVTVTLTNDEGESVNIFIPGPHDGKGEIALDLEKYIPGGPLEDGVYTMTATAAVGDANPVDVTVLGGGRVMGVTYEDGSPRLMLDELVLSMSDVVIVMSGETAEDLEDR